MTWHIQNLLGGKCVIKIFKKKVFLKCEIKHHQIRVDEIQIGKESVGHRRHNKITGCRVFVTIKVFCAIRALVVGIQRCLSKSQGWTWSAKSFDVHREVFGGENSATLVYVVFWDWIYYSVHFVVICQCFFECGVGVVQQCYVCLLQCGPLCPL